ILQGAGLLKKGRARGRHRRRRERKACFGEMLHLDGSPHPWLELARGQKQTLIQVADDATNRLLYAQLWEGETVQAVMSALKEVIVQYGIPASLYTDRAGWAFETPKAGEKVSKTHLTQVGKDNVVSMEGTALQIARQPGRPTCAGLHVTVRRHLDRCYSIRRGTQVFGRYDADGQPIEPRRPVEAAGPVGNRQRTRFPTRT